MNSNTGERRWHFDISMKCTNFGTEITENKINYKSLKAAFGRNVSKIGEYMFADPYEVGNFPIFRIIDKFYRPAQKIFSDISTGFIYNLIPAKIKESEDIARTPEISQDGSGFAATLYKIQELNSVTIFGPHSIFNHSDSSVPDIEIESLKEYFKLINQSIVDVYVVSDTLENKLVAVAKIKSKEGDIEIPLTFLSDGTVKWLSLVTAILSKKAIFSIEEPENFLHPAMQREIIEIIRANSDKEVEFFSIITTHSETLLNSLQPEEIVLCKLKDGATEANRDIPAEILKDEINKTGFGLGYYYVNGMLD